MLLADLKSDLTVHDRHLPVLLANRPNSNGDLARNEAQVRGFGEMLIDETCNDVDIRATNNDTGLNVAQVLELIERRPEAVKYDVNGIDDEVLLPDGRTVRSSIPVLGVLGTGNSVLLLLGSPEQWPSIQFQ